MTETVRTLSVILADEVVGTLEQLSTGGRRFTYVDTWAKITTPLSLSMPLRKAPYRQKVVDPYLWGLMPDNHETRRTIGRQFGVSSNNPMALLSKIGLDCAGAVRFCHPDAIKEALEDKIVDDDEVVFETNAIAFNAASPNHTAVPVFIKIQHR